MSVTHNVGMCHSFLYVASDKMAVLPPANQVLLPLLFNIFDACFIALCILILKFLAFKFYFSNFLLKFLGLLKRSRTSCKAKRYVGTCKCRVSILTVNSQQT